MQAVRQVPVDIQCVRGMQPLQAADMGHALALQPPQREQQRMQAQAVMMQIDGQLAFVLELVGLGYAQQDALAQVGQHRRCSRRDSQPGQPADRWCTGALTARRLEQFSQHLETAGLP